VVQKKRRGGLPTFGEERSSQEKEKTEEKRRTNKRPRRAEGDDGLNLPHRLTTEKSPESSK